jgi:3-deoxy-D-manno-octulosonic-acid transferase
MLGSRPTWIAGSTHAGEEEIVLEAHRRIRGAVPDALLILAPRHSNRFETVGALLGRRGWRAARRSAAAEAAVGADTEVLLLDTLGELLAWYAAADVAFVGGSLVPIGGHNLLEPAAAAVPVLTGPFYTNGKDIAALLLSSGGAREVRDAIELATAVSELLAEPAERLRVGAIGRNVVMANRGSAARLLAAIESRLAARAALQRNQY